jgi:hypothetical protein
MMKEGQNSTEDFEDDIFGVDKTKSDSCTIDRTRTTNLRDDDNIVTLSQ